jgi:hypothetical protein
MSTPPAPTPASSNASIIPVPMLAPSGWTTSFGEKADALLSHFFLSDYYQSNIYQGNISNLQYLIQRWGQSDIVPLLTNTRITLEKYLGRYYSNVQATVTSNGTDPNYTGGEMKLKISVLVTEQGTQYSFGYLVSLSNSIISDIQKLNNNGPAF